MMIEARRSGCRMYGLGKLGGGVWQGMLDLSGGDRGERRGADIVDNGLSGSL